MPGTYSGTQFYFNGGSPALNSGTGLGHSINNTQLGGFIYHYDVPETRVKYKFGIYNREKTPYNLSISGNLDLLKFVFYL